MCELSIYQLFLQAVGIFAIAIFVARVHPRSRWRSGRSLRHEPTKKKGGN